MPRNGLESTLAKGIYILVVKLETEDTQKSLLDTCSHIKK